MPIGPDSDQDPPIRGQVVEPIGQCQLEPPPGVAAHGRQIKFVIVSRSAHPCLINSNVGAGCDIGRAPRVTCGQVVPARDDRVTLNTIAV